VASTLAFAVAETHFGGDAEDDPERVDPAN
jgi:hypothetical protein